MQTQPTAEEAARHLLHVFEAHKKLRAGQVLVRGITRTEFLGDHQWHTEDFVAALRYASEHHWVAMPSPTVIKLTEQGCAEMAASISPDRGQ